MEQKVSDLLFLLADTWKRTKEVEAKFHVPQSETGSIDEHRLQELSETLDQLEQNVNLLAPSNVIQELVKAVKRKQSKRRQRSRQRTAIYESKVRNQQRTVTGPLLVLPVEHDEFVEKAVQPVNVTKRKRLRKITKTFELLKSIRKLHKIRSDSSTESPFQLKLDQLEAKLKALRDSQHLSAPRNAFKVSKKANERQRLFVPQIAPGAQEKSSFLSINELAARAENRRRWDSFLVDTKVSGPFCAYEEASGPGNGYDISCPAVAACDAISGMLRLTEIRQQWDNFLADAPETETVAPSVQDITDLLRKEPLDIPLPVSDTG